MWKSCLAVGSFPGSSRKLDIENIIKELHRNAAFECLYIFREAERKFGNTVLWPFLIVLVRSLKRLLRFHLWPGRSNSSCQMKILMWSTLVALFCMGTVIMSSQGFQRKLNRWLNGNFKRVAPSCPGAQQADLINQALGFEVHWGRKGDRALAYANESVNAIPIIEEFVTWSWNICASSLDNLPSVVITGDALRCKWFANLRNQTELLWIMDMFCFIQLMLGEPQVL